MIKFPNLNNYVSDYKNPSNVITIRIYEYPNKSKAKYFNVHTPFPYGAFVEMLQDLVNQKGINNLRIEQVVHNNDAEEINIWQLAWFINNTIQVKRVLIKIINPDDKENYLLTGIYTNDKEDFNRLKKQINRFYDKDFDGIVD